MITSAADMLNWGEAVWWHWFAVFLRAAAITSLIPAFGEQNVPVRVKLGVALALATVAAPAIADQSIGFTDLPAALFTMITEIANGLVLGIALRLFVIALQTAGAIAAQSTSLSQLLGSAGAEPMPAIGHVLVIGGLALAVTFGLHIRAAQFIIGSYNIFPAGEFPGPEIVSQWGVTKISQGFALSFQLAAPFLIASVLYNLTLGVINRAMPQLMVAFVGAPVITAGGLILLLIASPLMLSIWLEALNAFLAYPVWDSP